MPELPEVESVRSSLLDAVPPLLGSSVASVRIARASVVAGCAADSFVEVLAGAVFHEIVRHGKYLFFRFETTRDTDWRWMVLHLRMTGRLFLVPSAASLTKHTRFTITLTDGRVVRFDDPRAFGRVWLVTDPREITAALGPDALTVERGQFLGRLSVSRRQLKPLLLDQSFIAGVGNIYADESLFRAGLHPLRNASSLHSNEQECLYNAVHGVLEQAVACQGANIDGVFEAGNFPVAVYGRTGKPCPVCGAPIKKLRVSQRGTHLCPVCQQLH